jgi:hypothetical protein
MNCSSCGNQIPPGGAFCSACGAPVAGAGGVVNTGDGGVLSGTATAQGDIIVGSQEIRGGYVRTNTGLSAADAAQLARLFQPVYRQVQAHAASDPDSDADLLQSTAQHIEQEAAKGEAADAGKVRKWLNTLAKLAPDVLEVTVNALTNPGAAVASAVRLVAHTIRAGTDQSAGR